MGKPWKIFRAITGAREKDKSPDSITNDGEDVEKSSGGGPKGKEREISSSSDSGGALSSSTSEKSSSKVEVVNQTNKLLALREKVGPANGVVRYRIEAGKSIIINVGPQSTYFRLLVYAVEVGNSTTEDTGLTIDSDQLGAKPCIVISKVNGGKYSMPS